MVDLYIDPIEVSNAIGDIKKTIESIEEKISILKSKLIVVGQDFIGENYEKARDNAKKAELSLSIMLEDLKSANKFLNQLLEKTEAYIKNAY